MNSALTISTLTFTQAYSDKSGSLRREVSRGVNLPELMYIKHQNYTDSATKRPGTQSALIFEYVKALADGTIVPAVRATLKVQALTDANVTSADVLAVIERVVNTIQEDDTGLDLADEIFVNKEQ
jgi:hypothetical protein